MKRRWLGLIGLLAATLGLMACASSPASRSTDDAAPLWSMELFVKSQDGRYTYYEISEEGQLAYAGGRMAAQRVARPVGELPSQVRQQLWGLIERHQLMLASGDWLFIPQGQIGYDLHLKVDGRNQRILAADDQVAGLKEMSDLLFRTQLAKRYATSGQATNLTGLSGE